MDIQKIKQLIELVEESEISELKISEGEESICIVRSKQSVVQPTFIQPPQQIMQQPIIESKQIISEPEVLVGHIVKSPMVGSFYRTPSPESKAFAEVGQSVKTGDVLCIIEAMKMMNQIESDKSGIIKAILVENGQAVEFDQPLFIIE